MIGRVTFDQQDSDLELNLGGQYSQFWFQAGCLYDDDESTVQYSEGEVMHGVFQQAKFRSSNGSNHTSGSVPDRCVKLKKRVGTSWVTVLEVEFIARTSIGARFNVITENADYPVTITAL